jgi:hypothetical protein
MSLESTTDEPEEKIRSIENLEQENFEIPNFFLLSEAELRSLLDTIHNRIIDIASVANGEVLAQSERSMIEKHGFIGRLFIFQMHRLLPVNMWRRFDTDVPDCSARIKVQTLEHNAQYIREVRTNRFPNPIARYLHTVPYKIQQLLPPNFKKKEGTTQ